MITSDSAVAAARRSKAIPMLVLATAFWGLSFPLMKALVTEQTSLVPSGTTWFFTWLGVALRFGAAALLLALFLGRNLRSLSRLEIEQGLGLGAFGVAGILFQMDGLAYTNASTSAFLTQSYVVIIPLWLALTRRHVPTPRLMVSLGFMLIGLTILSGADLSVVKLGRGETETLIGSVMFAGQILWLEHPRYARNRSLCFSAVMFGTMAFLCWPGIALTAPTDSGLLRAYSSPAALAFLAALVLVCTMGAYLFMNQWQRAVSATEASLIYCLEPVFASLFALFLPAWLSSWTALEYGNEHLTARLLWGGGIITFANVLLHGRRRRALSSF